MAWIFSQDRPVYIQIAERITRSVLSGEYKPGDQVPSVRQLALDAAVNPNTVQKAFSELENEKIIISKGTLGRFVTDNTEDIEMARRKTAETIMKKYLKDMEELSIQKEQAITLLKEVNIWIFWKLKILQKLMVIIPLF